MLVALVLTVLLIQIAQLAPISLQLKAPNSTNPSDLTATSASTLPSTSSNQSIIPNLSAWRGVMSSAPTQKAGCFAATYPSTVWQLTQCVTAPLVPLQPYKGGTIPSTVGDGNNEVAYSSSKLIGSSSGSFQVSGLTSETDSMYGTNNYGLQLNSQSFTTSTSYTGSKSATGWEQFVWINWPSSNSVGYEYIQYWLIDYDIGYGGCPSTGPPGGSSWTAYQGSCYANSPGVLTPLESATNLASLSLEGLSNHNNAPYDVDVFCVSGTCYDVTITDQVVNLYQNWYYSEFNVFGAGSGSEANFNSGTLIIVTNSLKDQSGNVIVPSCVNTGFTGETNNLNLGSCSSYSSGQIVFTESNAVQALTTSVASGSGSVSPSCPSGCSEMVGSAVSVTATPSSGWQFLSWSTQTGVSCSVNPCTFSMPNNAVTLEATFTPILLLSSIAGNVVTASAGSVSFVLPDFTGPRHTSAPKCGGIGSALLTDYSAGGYLLGMLSNVQQETIDTSTLLSQVSGSCGEFTGSNGVVVLMAGPNVNEAVAYHERVASDSPLYFNCLPDGTCAFVERVSGVRHQVVPLTVGTDYFLIEAFTDSQGKNVYVIYGAGWQGTLAGAVYFNRVIYPNISTYTKSWYIYEWQDASSGVSHNAYPDPGDTYTPIASG